MVSLLLTIIYQFINAIFLVIPNSSGFPVAMTDTISDMFSYIYMFDFIVPVSTLLAVATFIVGVESVFLVYKFVMFIIRLIRR